MPAKARRRIYRSKSDRLIAGVLGGLSDYLGIEPSLTRIGYLVFTVLTGFVPGIFLYLVMVIIIPGEPEPDE
jgi:phage shock protein C